MLQTLSLQNFALVESLQLDFQTGFIAITGETGAGKSLLLQALMLCAGERAHAQFVRHGAEFAQVCAIFESHNPAVGAWFDSRDMAFDGEVIIKRKITTQGRAKAWVNGEAVSVSELKQLGKFLVSVQAQHAATQLLQPLSVLYWLDDVADLSSLAEDVQVAYNHYKQAQNLLQQSKDSAQLRDEKIALLQSKIDDFSPLIGQDLTKINQEYDELANAKTLMANAALVCQTLDGDSDPMPSILSSLAKLQKICQNSSNISPSFAKAQDLLITATDALQTAHELLHNYAQNQNDDGERLQTLDALLSLAHRLSQKYRMPIHELCAQMNEWQNELEDLQNTQNTAILQEKLNEAKKHYDVLAEKLYQKRTSAAPKLCQTLCDKLKKLALPHAKCQFVFTPSAPTKYGAHSIELMFSANVGMPLMPLHKVASGGELSRICLVMQLMQANTKAHTPMLVFDEVDVGMSGAAAHVVGQMLQQLGRNGQLVAITHQAQVAAAACHHLLAKKHHDNHSQSSFMFLNDGEKQDELSRMSGGVHITAETRAHAKSLQKLAQYKGV